jgi:hypothetical protein
MDGLVAKLCCCGCTRCSALRTGPQQLCLQLNFPLFECLSFPELTHVEVSWVIFEKAPEGICIKQFDWVGRIWS